MMNGSAQPVDMDDDRFVAAVDLVRRTGAMEFSIRWDEPDDKLPVAWCALARWRLNTEGRPVGPGEPFAGMAVKVGAGLDPVVAVLDLAAKAIDGGQCVHCGKPAGLEERFDAPDLFGEVICWYQWDPELATFRRACEELIDAT